jgi:hypothetical protein
MLHPSRAERSPREGAGRLPAPLLEETGARHLIRPPSRGRGIGSLRLAKHSRTRGRILLLAGVIALLCCLGLLVCLSASAASDDVPSSSVPSASASANGDGGPDAPAPDANHPPMLGEEVQQAERHPVNAPLLTMLVLALPSFGASVLSMATNDRRRWAASRLWGVEDRRWLAVACEGPSFLGVFLL